jgi:trans-2,3-dihydro-3-hydroxyanthranilate isomerase
MAIPIGAPSKKLDYHLVDVFTETAFQGNALAVVFDTVGLSTERMQAIAREFNLSETTFIQRRGPGIEKSEGVHVRIFTTLEELPFAGHPTLGTASVLKEYAPEVLDGDTIRLALKVGTIPVRFKQEGLFGEMTQRDPEFGDQLDPAEVARLCGLRTDDLHATIPPQVVSTGTAFAIVALRSHRPLARLQVDQKPATRYLREHGGRWFYVMGPTEYEIPAWRARMQFYGGEDPATGSAAGCAISYLVHHQIVHAGRQIHVQQGVEIGRTSDLLLSADVVDSKVTDVRVGGSTVPVAKGQIFLP